MRLQYLHKQATSFSLSHSKPAASLVIALPPASARARPATVKITPSDDKGRAQVNKRPMIMMKAGSAQDQSASNIDRELVAANMLRAPTEDATKSRW